MKLSNKNCIMVFVVFTKLLITKRNLFHAKKSKDLSNYTVKEAYAFKGTLFSWLFLVLTELSMYSDSIHGSK